MTEQLILMWNAGATSAEIADALNITRSAVMGKISRLRAKGAALRSATRAAPKRPVRKVEVRTPRGWRPALVLIEQPRPAAPPPPAAVGLLDLTPGMCRYINGRDARGALYCGAPREYRSYCKAHADLCYVPVREYKLDKAQH